MSKKLQGQVAVVTGASKGIGAAIAEHLAEAGAAAPELMLMMLPPEGPKCLTASCVVNNSPSTLRLNCL